MLVLSNWSQQSSVVKPLLALNWITHTSYLCEKDIIYQHIMHGNSVSIMILNPGWLHWAWYYYDMRMCLIKGMVGLF